jgi:hypothetical protein
MRQRTVAKASLTRMQNFIETGDHKVNEIQHHWTARLTSNGNNSQLHVQMFQQRQSLLRSWSHVAEHWSSSTTHNHLAQLLSVRRYNNQRGLRSLDPLIAMLSPQRSVSYAMNHTGSSNVTSSLACNQNDVIIMSRNKDYVLTVYNHLLRITNVRTTIC